MRCVGAIVEGQGVSLCKEGRREDISYRGYDHFNVKA
jgi:thiamine monophosphate kinase